MHLALFRVRQEYFEQLQAFLKHLDRPEGTGGGEFPSDGTRRSVPKSKSFGAAAWRRGSVGSALGMGDRETPFLG